MITTSGDPLLAFADALFAEGALGAELKAGDFGNPQLLADLFASGGRAAIAPVRTALARAAQARKDALHYDEARPARLLIALDQVERLFVEAAPERVDAFAALLRALVEEGLASVVAVLRSDTYGRFQAVAPFLALLETSRRNASTSCRRRRATSKTSSHGRWRPAIRRSTYETDGQGRSLAEVLVADAHGGDALPLLQMTLQRLFDAEAQRGDGVLRFADYPGMDAAVARTAEEAVAGLDARALAALPALITASVRDVTIGADGALETLTIVPVARGDFERGDPARRALLDEFISRRLLTTEEVDGVGAGAAGARGAAARGAGGGRHHQGECGAHPRAPYARSDGGGMGARAGRPQGGFPRHLAGADRRRGAARRALRRGSAGADARLHR